MAKNPNENRSSLLARSVKVVYPVYQHGYPLDDLYEVESGIEDAENIITIDDPTDLDPYTETTRAGHPGCKVFRDTAPSYAGADNSQLDELTDMIAQDYYDRSSMVHDVVINGIADWSPEGISSAIEFSYTGSDMSTRVYTGPANDWPEELMHWACPQDGSSGAEDEPEPAVVDEDGNPIPKASEYFTGILPRITEFRCDGGKFYATMANEIWSNGVPVDLIEVGDFGAGCCDCGDVSSGGSS